MVYQRKAACAYAPDRDALAPAAAFIHQEDLVAVRLAGSTFFLCCPAPMTKSLLLVPRGLGVPDDRIPRIFPYQGLWELN